MFCLLQLQLSFNSVTLQTSVHYVLLEIISKLCITPLISYQDCSVSWTLTLVNLFYGLSDGDPSKMMKVKLRFGFYRS